MMISFNHLSEAFHLNKSVNWTTGLHMDSRSAPRSFVLESWIRHWSASDYFSIYKRNFATPANIYDTIR